MPVIKDLSRKIAYSPRLKDKRREKSSRPRGMTENQMRILDGIISEASRYIGNAHLVRDEPDAEQAGEIDARLGELMAGLKRSATVWG
jgi:hypothetical protein